MQSCPIGFGGYSAPTLFSTSTYRYLEAFPNVRGLVTKEEVSLIANYRSWMNDLDKS